MAKKNGADRPVRSRHKVVEFENFDVPAIDEELVTEVRTRLGLNTSSRIYSCQTPVSGLYSRYKGVKKGHKTKPFRGRVKYKGVQYDLGYFTDEKNAARAYDKAALELWGDDALTNQEYFGDLE